MRLHDLRHVHATLLLKAGVPVHVVASRLGHADPAITLRVYAHVLRDQASEVAQVFASVVDTGAIPSLVLALALASERRTARVGGGDRSLTCGFGSPGRNRTYVACPDSKSGGPCQQTNRGLSRMGTGSA